MIYVAWLLSLVATGGSLFFSEIMLYPPCVLCWYQRIAMYPLVIILGRGVLKHPAVAMSFAWPLALIGWLVALYHNLLYYKILPESAAPCRTGVSCTSFHIEWWGFITIPLLSLTAFTLILIIAFLMKRKTHE